MSGHTPGPWEWVGDDIDGPEYATVLERTTECGSYCLGGTTRLLISDDDRRLIAAAPALYDAAERAKDILEGFVNEGLWTSTAKIDEVVHDITDIINEIDTGDPS